MLVVGYVKVMFDCMNSLPRTCDSEVFMSIYI